MTISRDWPIKSVARLLIVTLMSPLVYAAPQTQTVQQSEQSETDKLPDSPGVSQTQPERNWNQLPQTQPSSGDSTPVQSADQPSLTAQNQGQPPSSTASQQSETHQPLGTAAAESIPTMGIAASQPAGAAVAPAKQRRVRTILISVGAVVAAAAAVGAVVALSEGSPSRPPGAH